MSITKQSVTVHECDPKKLWSILSDWSAPFITPANSPATVSSLEGSGVGATRIVTMGEGAEAPTWSEEVTAFDDVGMTWSYKLCGPLPGPFGVADHTTFTCTMSVADKDGKSEVTISGSFDLVEGASEDTLPPISEMYGGWASAAAALANGVLKKVSVTTHDVDAKKLWSILSDWSAPFITPANSPATVSSLEGSGVGATRIVTMGEGAEAPTWSEEVTAFDDVGMTWSYKLCGPLPGPFGVADHTTFTCTMSVAEKGSGSEISIHCQFKLLEGKTEEGLPPIAEMYAGWASAAAELASK